MIERTPITHVAIRLEGVVYSLPKPIARSILNVARSSASTPTRTKPSKARPSDKQNEARMQPMRYWLFTGICNMTMRKRPSGESRPLNAVLKLHGIEWAYFDHEGRLAFGYGKFAIHYDANLRQYVLKESGEVLLSDVSPSKLMDLAPEYIFDAVATTIQPSWSKDN